MEDMSQYLEEFLSDARDRIDSISNAVLRLEEAVKNGDEEAKRASIDQIFRDAHTLKGTAATMGGFMKLSEAAHKMENLFDAIRNGLVEATPDVVDLVLEFIEAIEEMINNIEETGKEGDVDVDELFEKANALLKGVHQGERGQRRPRKKNQRCLLLKRVPPSEPGSDSNGSFWKRLPRKSYLLSRCTAERCQGFSDPPRSGGDR
ncbi:Hpt domain-containing protein [Thermococcus sp. JCM 11816]|uniref:Hpt domain-containing protein n=1 Tax=Thermococcus sp. (strain JCM 11816 / KS-1) TaxID=1295125 RepID=UPI000A5CF228